MDFPDEIMVDILRRLPVKSLVRFRCVSKSWRCLISDPTFVRTHLEFHMGHIYFGTASRIALSREADTLLSLWPHENGGDDGDGHGEGFAVTEELDLDLLKNSHYHIKGHCDGLLCLLVNSRGLEGRRLVVYNPSIREHRILPLPPYFFDTWELVGMGYDPSIDDYKIVSIPSIFVENYLRIGRVPPISAVGCCKSLRVIPRVEIYTLKSKSNSWRSLPQEDAPPYGTRIMFEAAANAHGGLYWLCLDQAAALRHVILRFDLVEEKFRMVPLPPPLPDESYSGIAWLGSLKDSLSVICSQNAIVTHIHIWSTKDDKTWTKLITFPMLRGPETAYFFSRYVPFCYTKSGALLMYIRGEEVGFVMYEPRENMFRKLTVRGAEEDIHQTLYCESLVSPNCWNADEDEAIAGRNEQ